MKVQNNSIMISTHTLSFRLSHRSIQNTVHSNTLFDTGTDPPIRLGREPANECTRGLRCPNCPPFREVVFNATARNETFVANIGPPGNERGYMAITSELCSNYNVCIQGPAT